MAINKITDPSALPTSTDDYVAQNNAINTHTLNTTPPYPVSGSNIVKGSVFNIGGDLFYTDSDTAITGVSSDYVKLTPGATTAVPTYETAANITANVTWNDAYNGYYDSSGNLYIFDEVNAFSDDVITELKTLSGRESQNRRLLGSYRAGTANSYELFDWASKFLEVGGSALVSGVIIELTGGLDTITIVYASRAISNRIDFWGLDQDGSTNGYSAYDGVSGYNVAVALAI